jgi:hypothetical protein
MARTGESIELIVAEGLWASSIPETRPIPDGVIDILCLVDLGAGGSELMQDIGRLRGGISCWPQI